jgi:hypothetical protein
MRRIASPIALVVLGLAIAACSDSSTGPSNGGSAPDLATLLAETAPSSLGSAVTFASPTMGSALSTAPTFDPGSCTYTAQTGFFVCPATTRGGMTYTLMFRLIDAAGNSQSLPTAQTVAIETKTTVKGTSTPPAGARSTGSFTIDGSSDMTLSGIQTDKHTLNGTSVTMMTGSLTTDGITVPLNTSMNEKTTDLVLPNAKAGQKWPQSGTIAIDQTSNTIVLGSTVPETSHMVMTFNGTSVVTVTITSGIGTVTCQFDMANPGASGGACS